MSNLAEKSKQKELLNYFKEAKAKNEEMGLKFAEFLIFLDKQIERLEALLII